MGVGTPVSDDLPDIGAGICAKHTNSNWESQESMNNGNKMSSAMEAAAREMERVLSPGRFSTYLRAADEDGEKAARLYAWNTAVCAAFYGPLQALEVALRNAMHERLAERYGAEWYDNAEVCLNDKHRGQVEEAKERLRQTGKAVTPPHVVAALSFGFWVFLLTRNYNQRLWRPTLRGAFPYVEKVTRQEAFVLLIELLEFRNRIAHHEPIFASPLRKRHSDILKIIGWISPCKRDWVVAHSRLEEVLDMPRDRADLRF